ncbi:MAG: type I-F CRISPR-associated endoribonuclease Cas6/Csy4 [Alphaproteobacteria bacterium]
MHMFTCTIEQDAGLTPGVVFGLAVSHLHLHHPGQVGIAFPEAQTGKPREFDQPMPPTLGTTLQVFGDDAVLEHARTLMLPLGDYLRVGRVRLVRPTAEQIIVRRRRALDKTTPAAMARALRRTVRLAEQKGRPLSEEALAERRQKIAQASYGFPADHLPYLTLRSLSTKSRMMVHFETTTVAAACPGTFDSYGFSKNGATLPKVG